MSASEPETKGQSTFSGCLVRFVWMAVGNAAMLMLAVKIAQSEARALSVFDLAFWVTALVIAGARYLDIRRFAGQTVEGEPATMAHWRRHALGLAAFAVALALAAHGVAAAGWLK